MKTALYFFLPVSLVSTLFGIQAFKSHQLARAALEDRPRVSAPISAPTSLPVANVKIESFIFAPKDLNIRPGTTVTWQNADDVPHTATSKDDPQTFDSGALDTDDKFSFTFTKPGTFIYYCKVHPHMTGTVTVK